MKTFKLFYAIFVITLLFITKTATAQNQFNYNTQYPVWHYFDNALGNLGTSPYSYSDSGSSVDPGTLLCNRGISSTVRNAMKYYNSANGVYKYDVSELDSKGWYILQIDGDFKVEFSNDNANWTTVLAANGNYIWTDKGPTKNMSPYYLDLKNFLPADYLYFKISDNTTGTGNGARALNALITEEGYPNFYAGGGEPGLGSTGGQYPGDQQFLFSKGNTSDRETGGRFADQTATFIYKFDLPDDNDDCELIAYVSQQYKVEISKDWDFSTIFYSTQSTDTSDTQHRIGIDLKTLLSQTSDNVIYFRMSDSVTGTGWGGDLRSLWIAPQIPAIGKSFVATDEIESNFLWENNNSVFISDWGFRFTDGHNYATYRFNLGAEATNSQSITINTSSEYLFQGSSNGVDWVDIFVAPAGYRAAETLTFYPFTGKTIGFGAQSGIPNLVAPIFNGSSNVFFLKMGDSDSSGGWGGQMKGISVDINTSKFIFAKTFFQVNMSYDPKAALPVDAVIVHRHGDPKAVIYNAIKSWRDENYNVGRMFFADSDAGEHYWKGDWDGQTHTNDCEHDSSGNIISVGGYRPYMLPTDGWTDYLKEMTEQSIDVGAIAILPEEPLAHVFSGYEESFKPIWANRYGFPWQAENSSEIARFLTGQLKAELYFQLELDLAQTAKQYGNNIDFVIPIHSIFGNIAAQLTAPLGMSSVTNGFDGYVGQVWTGPIRWALDNYSAADESFFGSAFALYDFFKQLTIQSDKKLWLLVDPVEDDPNHSWNDYAAWYQHSVAAMLMMSEVDSYEIMPWPERIFMPGYETGGGTPAPEGFRIRVLTISQVLQDVAKGGEWLPVGSTNKPTEGIAVAVADSVMYQNHSNPKLQGTYGMIMPLVQRGIPISSFAMERVQDTNYADLYKVIILSYEDFKPVTPEMNVALADWVKRGGSLLVLGSTTDSLDAATYFWWHGLGYSSPIDHLMAQFSGGYGSGNVIRNTISPSAFANSYTAENTYLPLVEQAVQNSTITGDLQSPGGFCMKRGDFVIAHSTKSNVSLAGKFVDIFNTNLAVISNINLSPDQSGLYKDVTDILSGNIPALLQTSHRLMSQEYSNNVLEFVVKGPLETPAVARIFLPRDFTGISAEKPNGQSVPLTSQINGNSCLLKFPNSPDSVIVSVDFSPSTLTNTFEWADTIPGLSAQPQSDDLAQLPGSINLLVSGSMHTGVSPNEFSSLFNSDVDGSYGPGGPNSDGIVLFNDLMSPDSDAVIHCDFDSPNIIREINVFSKWSDHRLFTYFEVWASTTGTNDSDYNRIGKVTFGNYGETNTPYNNKNCLASLYDPTDNIIAENVISIKLVKKNCAYELDTGSGVKQPPGSPLGIYSMVLGPAVGEIDIIGIPEPVAIFSLFFIFYNLWLYRRTQKCHVAERSKLSSNNKAK